MKIITANGKNTIKMSKAEWLKIGKNAGWIQPNIKKIATENSDYIDPLQERSPNPTTKYHDLYNEYIESYMSLYGKNNPASQFEIRQSALNSIISSALTDIKRTLKSTNDLIKQNPARNLQNLENLDPKELINIIDEIDAKRMHAEDAIARAYNLTEDLRKAIEQEHPDAPITRRFND